LEPKVSASSMAETGGIRAGYPAWIRVAMERGVGTVSGEVDTLAVAARGIGSRGRSLDANRWPRLGVLPAARVILRRLRSRHAAMVGRS
jgi:hypothetical protein